MCSPIPEQEKRAEEDQKKMRAIYDTVTPERLWDGKFRLPLKDVTTGGNFGRRRILNGESRSPHAGVDFPAATGTAVFASQSGKVVLAENLYYSGNTVVIDHGYGIYTLYAHLSKIGVQPDEMVKAGDEIGKVGATGRVTGPHLHWGLTIDHARVNAMGIAQRAALSLAHRTGRSLQIRTHNFDEILGSLRRGFRFARHVIQDVILHQFAHQAVDGAAGGSQALENVGAVGILFQTTKDGFQLADDFLGAGNEFNFFTNHVGHNLFF